MPILWKRKLRLIDTKQLAKFTHSNCQTQVCLCSKPQHFLLHRNSPLETAGETVSFIHEQGLLSEKPERAREEQIVSHVLYSSLDGGRAFRCLSCRREFFRALATCFPTAFDRFQFVLSTWAFSGAPFNFPPPAVRLVSSVL